MSQSRLVLVALLFCTGGFFTAPALAQNPACNNIITDTGTARVLSGYGQPFNLFSAAKELLVSGQCEADGSVKVSVGRQGDQNVLVHRHGYYWDGEWVKFPLSGGEAMDADWYFGMGQANIPAAKNGAVFLLGFACVRTEGTWKCGCQDTACQTSAWQMQVIDTPAVAPSPTPWPLEPPPVMDSPVVFENVCPGETGWPTRNQMAGKDVKIVLPKDRVCKNFAVIGGTSTVAAKDLWVVGGKIEYQTSDTQAGAAMTVSNWTGTAFFEGMDIDVKNSCADGIRSYTAMGPDARVVIQNAYIRGMNYCNPGTHGDLYHAQGGLPVVKELVMQNVRGELLTQGIFVPYRESGHGVRKMTLERVDLRLDPRYPSFNGKIASMIYAGSYGTYSDLPPPDGQSYTQVYLNWWDPHYPSTINRKDITIPNVAGYDANNCGVFADDLKSSHKISGQWCKGPPQETFVPLDKIGLNYSRAHFTGN
jgi:hypothetical protein